MMTAEEAQHDRQRYDAHTRDMRNALIDRYVEIMAAALMDRANVRIQRESRAWEQIHDALKFELTP